MRVWVFVSLSVSVGLFVWLLDWSFVSLVLFVSGCYCKRLFESFRVCVFVCSCVCVCVCLFVCLFVCSFICLFSFV